MMNENKKKNKLEKEKETVNMTSPVIKLLYTIIHIITTIPC